jgi:Protein of unknown function (DUF4058)
MVLQDHFHPPLSLRRHWHSFHNAWATYIASDLNSKLPEGYFAEPNVQFGVEIDVAAFEQNTTDFENEGIISLPLSQANWTPPSPSQNLPFLPTQETVEINIFNTEGGPVLAGAIELVSPANKDRASHRNAFVSKCETFLRQGIGLVIIDVVTERKANLHNELLNRITEGASYLGAELYAASYRVIERNSQPSLDVWQEKISIGKALPTIPFWLRGNKCFPLELESIYERTCREQRIYIKTA